MKKYFLKLAYTIQSVSVWIFADITILALLGVEFAELCVVTFLGVVVIIMRSLGKESSKVEAIKAIAGAFKK